MRKELKGYGEGIQAREGRGGGRDALRTGGGGAFLELGRTVVEVGYRVWEQREAETGRICQKEGLGTGRGRVGSLVRNGGGGVFPGEEVDSQLLLEIK